MKDQMNKQWKAGRINSGLGAVATTMIAGVGSSEERISQADWFLNADRKHPSWESERKTEIQKLRSLFLWLI